MVFHLLRKGANIEAEGQLGTPLRTAVTMDWEDMVCELLQAGANPNPSSPFGDALQAAAIKGHASMTRRLLQEGASPNNSGGYYGNALQAAAYNGHTDVVKLLLDAGALVHSIGFAKDVFHAAVEEGQEHIVQFFLDRGFHFHQPGRSSCSAMDIGPPPFQDLLRAASPSRKHKDIREDSNIPWVASSDSLSENQRSLIEGNGFPPSSYRKPEQNMENYALQAAASNEHASVVRMLLNQWEELDGELQGHEVGTALKEAASKGHDRVVGEFLRSKWDLKSHLLEAMKSAAAEQALEIFEMLLAHWKQLYTKKNPTSPPKQHSLTSMIASRPLSSEFSEVSHPCSLISSEPLILLCGALFADLRTVRVEPTVVLQA